MPPNRDVLFVVLDSLRKDRVSLYGHERETTPMLDSLAQRATVYENAYTPAPWTLPSHASMFTGRFPSEHGVTNGFTDRSLELPEAVTTVTERLAETGFRTAGFSNNPWVGTLSGLNRGFEEYVEWNLAISERNGTGIHRRRDRVYSRASTVLGHASRQPLSVLKRPFFTSNLVERASNWLRETDGGAFTFLNLMEAHNPYFPPKRAFAELGLDPPGPVEPRLLNTRLLAYTMGRRDLEDERSRVLEYYDACVRYEDGLLGELVGTLRELGRFDDALLVVCADHGKTLGEYDRDAVPPHYVRDVNTNVPLVVKYPGQREGTRVEAPVELTSLFELFVGDHEERLPEAPDGALTEDFVPHTGRTSTDVTRWRVLADTDVKYVRSDDGRAYLFERGERGERPNRSERIRERMCETLDDRIEGLAPTAERADQPARELGGDVESQLEDLGYLG